MAIAALPLPAAAARAYSDRALATSPSLQASSPQVMSHSTKAGESPSRGAAVPMAAAAPLLAGAGAIVVAGPGCPVAAGDGVAAGPQYNGCPPRSGAPGQAGPAAYFPSTGAKFGGSGGGRTPVLAAGTDGSALLSGGTADPDGVIALGLLGPAGSRGNGIETSELAAMAGPDPSGDRLRRVASEPPGCDIVRLPGRPPLPSPEAVVVCVCIREPGVGPASVRTLLWRKRKLSGTAMAIAATRPAQIRSLADRVPVAAGESLNSEGV